MPILRRLSFRLILSRDLHWSAAACGRQATTSVPIRKKKAAKAWNDVRDRKSAASNAFVDYRRVRVKAGDGGDGKISMASVFKVEFAGPDGGDGGHGGHVIFRAFSGVQSLIDVPSFIQAAAGGAGQSGDCFGKNAPHRIVKVPIGTVIKNLEQDVLCELAAEGDMFLAARGGAGGKGNASFKSSTCQAPLVAEKGGTGECFTLDVELLTMAHVGLVGFPNAGKSTLLRAISRARPKVAAYPFTTLNPHVGMVNYDDYEQIAVADIPGIIPGAHKNKGLGISFLRHIERCVCLLFVIDLAQADPVGQLETLKFELEQYKAGLSKRPFAVLANKVDLESAQENTAVFAAYAKEHDLPVFYISGKVGLNLRSVLDYIRGLYDEHERIKQEDLRKKKEAQAEADDTFYKVPDQFT